MQDDAWYGVQLAPKNGVRSTEYELEIYKNGTLRAPYSVNYTVVLARDLNRGQIWKFTTPACKLPQHSGFRPYPDLRCTAGDPYSMHASPTCDLQSEIGSQPCAIARVVAVYSM